MHTKGQWITTGDGVVTTIGGANQIAICQGGTFKSLGEMRDNATAITAVPDFMEAAAMMTAAEQSGGEMWWKGFEMLKAAFKKAGGQFPSMDQS